MDTQSQNARGFLGFFYDSHLKYQNAISSSWLLHAILPDWVSKGKQARFATHPESSSWNIQGEKEAKSETKTTTNVTKLLAWPAYKGKGIHDKMSKKVFWTATLHGITIPLPVRKELRVQQASDNIKKEYPQHNRGVILCVALLSSSK